MKYGLSEDQLQEIIDFIKQYPEVEEVVLFGSRAIDTYKEASDVDIALKGEKVTDSLAAQLKFDIEEDTYLPFFFDFIAYPTITNEALRVHIDKKGVVIYWKAWREYRLGDLYDFASGLSKSRDQFGFGYGFLAFKDVFNNYFVPEELSELANTTEKERSRCSINRGDIFLTRNSETQEELGMSCVALKDYPDATFNGFTKRLRPKEQNKILPEFAGFYFRSPRFRAEVTSMASITTRASLNNGMLRYLSITIPPLPEQKAIASVLSSLDDKIDLLHRQNKTLEAMAETLFRQWFVEEAEEAWEEGKLGRLINISSGKGLKKDQLIENGAYRVLGANGELGRTNDFLFDENLLFTGRVGTLGNIFRIENEKVWLSDNTLVIKPISYFNFIYLLLKAAKLEEYNVGSTQPLIRQTDIKGIEISVPPGNKLNDFESNTEILFAKMRKNQIQIRTLEKLRDTLLPKLMSGEVLVDV